MDPRLDENEPELGILVFAVALQMLADADSLLDLQYQINSILLLDSRGWKALSLRDHKS